MKPPSANSFPLAHPSAPRWAALVKRREPTSFRRWKWDASVSPAPPIALPPYDDVQSPDRPAFAAATAAFRALAPFLSAQESAQLQRAFRIHSPLHCLNLVVRMTHLAVTRLRNDNLHFNAELATTEPLSVAHAVGNPVWGNALGVSAPKATHGSEQVQTTSSLSHIRYDPLTSSNPLSDSPFFNSTAGNANLDALSRQSQWDTWSSVIPIRSNSSTPSQALQSDLDVAAPPFVGDHRLNFVRPPS